jgi:hypothetical protein
MMTLKSKRLVPNNDTSGQLILIWHNSVESGSNWKMLCEFTAVWKRISDVLQDLGVSNNRPLFCETESYLVEISS